MWNKGQKGNSFTTILKLKQYFKRKKNIYKNNFFLVLICILIITALNTNDFGY